MVRCLPLWAFLLSASLGSATGAAAEQLASPAKCSPPAIRDAHAAHAIPDVTGCQLPEVSKSIQEFYNFAPAVDRRSAPKPATGPNTIVDQAPEAGPLPEGAAGMTLFLAKDQPTKSAPVTSTSNVNKQGDQVVYVPKNVVSGAAALAAQVEAERREAGRLKRLEQKAQAQILEVALAVILLLAGVSAAVVHVFRRPKVLSGSPVVECRINPLDGAVRFMDSERTVLSAPAFDWVLVSSAPLLTGPLVVKDLTVSEKVFP